MVIAIWVFLVLSMIVLALLVALWIVKQIYWGDLTFKTLPKRFVIIVFAVGALLLVFVLATIALVAVCSETHLCS